MTTHSSWFIEYRYNPNNNGTILCLPHAGASSVVFHSWVDMIPNNLNLVGVELPGRGQRFGETYSTSMDSIVHNLIKDFYFKTPYVIFGHSLGATIGYEFIKKIQLNNLPLHFFVSAQDIPGTGEFLHYNQDDQKLLAGLNTHYQGMPDNIRKDKESLSLALEILRSDLKILIDHEYEHKKLDVPITLMYAKGDKAIDKARTSLWKNYTTKKFQEIIFEGDHFYIDHTNNKILIINKLINSFGLGVAG